jgi:putative isomerase
MLRHSTIVPERAWNTWSSRPAEMVFLPLGVRLTPVAYASSTRSATLFPPGDAVRLGRHALDGSLVELELTHAGTKLAWSWHKAGPFELTGGWRTLTTGEWGLRFWINLCLWTEEGHAVRYDAARRAAIVKVGHRFVALAGGDAPVQVTGHADVEALAQDYQEHGYFYLGARAEEGRVIALRFNLEMTRDGRFALAVADRADIAADRAHALLAQPPAAPKLPGQSGRFAGALDAVRDVMAWNSVWDEINARPYTSISRNWNLAKFGGFGVWLNDQQYAALLTGLLDPEIARENFATTLASATPDGNLACLITANDAWIDRTQLPIGAFLAWLLYLRTGQRSFIALTYDTLARNHAWWWRRRDPLKRGLVSFGTSDLGEGLYLGTHFGARNESSMDNAPIHDEASYDPETRTLTTEDVGLNSLLALDAEMLARIAAELGQSDAAASHAATAEATRAKIRETLWDAERGLFANRLRSGAFVRSVGPTSFYPLICGAADAAQAERLIAHLDDAKTFGGRFVIPSVSRDDPAFADNTYWRGRIWPPLNFLVWHGLRRYGFDGQASQLAEKSFELFRLAWERRLCPENFNADTGEPLDQPDTDGFYSWGALMPALGVAEVMDVSPWNGWEIVNDGGPTQFGPVQSPAGAVTVAVADGVLTLAKREQVLLVTDIRGRIGQLRIEKGRVALIMPPMPAPGFIALPAVDPDQMLLARVGEADAAWRADGTGIRIDIPACSASCALTVISDQQTAASS